MSLGICIRCSQCGWGSYVCRHEYTVIFTDGISSSMYIYQLLICLPCPQLSAIPPAMNLNKCPHIGNVDSRALFLQVSAWHMMSLSSGGQLSRNFCAYSLAVALEFLSRAPTVTIKFMYSEYEHCPAVAVCSTQLMGKFKMLMFFFFGKNHSLLSNLFLQKVNKHIRSTSKISNYILITNTFSLEI
jgi:hypothetical protein